MKPFDLELAKAGNPVQTRDGRPARIVCYDIVGERQIGVLLTCITSKGEKFEVMHAYYENGRFNKNVDNDLDLFMATTKKEGWGNIYAKGDKREIGHLYESEKEAKDCVIDNDPTYITTTKIEWEE